MILGYNTNGLAHHDLGDAIRLLADIGYRSVAITVDHGSLNPFGADFSRQLDRVTEILAQYSMRSVIETGARFLLDPHVKHEPTLMTADSKKQARRIEFLCRCVDIAQQFGSDCVSLWSGVLRQDENEATESVAFDRLATGLRQVLDYADSRGVVIGFEPEPGMFIDTMARFQQLRQHPKLKIKPTKQEHTKETAETTHPAFALTLDVGHLHCQGETPIADFIRRFADQLVNVHIEDMRAAVHEHLMFGEGEIDFSPIADALQSIEYKGGVHVELSRHSHEGPKAAQKAYDFLAAHGFVK